MWCFEATGRVSAVRGKAHAYFHSDDSDLKSKLTPGNLSLARGAFDVLEEQLVKYGNDDVVSVGLDCDLHGDEFSFHSISIEVAPVSDWVG